MERDEIPTRSVDKADQALVNALKKAYVIARDHPRGDTSYTIRQIRGTLYDALLRLHVHPDEV